MKLVKDNYENTATVEVDDDSDVMVTVSGFSDECSAFFTPKQARRLAKAIKKAAKRAEAGE